MRSTSGAGASPAGLLANIFRLSGSRMDAVADEKDLFSVQKESFNLQAVRLCLEVVRFHLPIAWRRVELGCELLQVR